MSSPWISVDFPGPRAGGVRPGRARRDRGHLVGRGDGSGRRRCRRTSGPRKAGVSPAATSPAAGQAACTAVYVEGSNEGITLDLAPDPGSGIDSISGCDGELCRHHLHYRQAEYELHHDGGLCPR